MQVIVSPPIESLAVKASMKRKEDSMSHILAAYASVHLKLIERGTVQGRVFSSLPAQSP